MIGRCFRLTPLFTGRLDPNHIAIISNPLPPTINYFCNLPLCLMAFHCFHYHPQHFVTDEKRRHVLPCYGSVSPYFKQVLNEYCAASTQLLHQVNPYRLIHLVNQLL